MLRQQNASATKKTVATTSSSSSSFAAGSSSPGTARKIAVKPQESSAAVSLASAADPFALAAPAQPAAVFSAAFTTQPAPATAPPVASAARARPKAGQPLAPIVAGAFAPQMAEPPAQAFVPQVASPPQGPSAPAFDPFASTPSTQAPTPMMVEEPPMRAAPATVTLPPAPQKQVRSVPWRAVRHTVQGVPAATGARRARPTAGGAAISSGAGIMLPDASAGLRTASLDAAPTTSAVAAANPTNVVARPAPAAVSQQPAVHQQQAAAQPAAMAAAARDVAELEELLETIEQETQEEPAVAAPAPARSHESKLHGLTRHVWNLATPDAEGTLSGLQLRPLMMMSKVPTDVLAQVWNSVDVTRAGKVFAAGTPIASSRPALQLNQAQLFILLGVLSQVQQGQAVDAGAVTDATAPPHLEGLKPM